MTANHTHTLWYNMSPLISVRSDTVFVLLFHQRERGCRARSVEERQNVEPYLLVGKTPATRWVGQPMKRSGTETNRVQMMAREHHLAAPERDRSSRRITAPPMTMAATQTGMWTTPADPQATGLISIECNRTISMVGHRTLYPLSWPSLCFCLCSPLAHRHYVVSWCIKQTRGMP